MDFFQAQEDARRKSVWLVMLMGTSVLSLVLLAFVMMGTVLWYAQQGVHLAHSLSFYLTPELFLACLVTIGGIVLTGSLIKLVRLGKGSGTLMRAMGGRQLTGGPDDLRELVLRNLVEEISIASGAPVPQLYILDDEPAINAFAAGFSLDDAALGFTRGCIERLSRDELEGVVAHEFSHLVHGDSRLNLKLMGVLHGITMISSLGYQMLRSQRYRSSRSRNGASLSLVGVGLLVIGYSGVFFAGLIRSAVSRQREFLADASAVQYTRNTGGLADALKRIGGYPLSSTLNTPLAADAAHMMFSKAVSSWVGGLFATHPPLPQRITRLEPQWRGDFLEGVGEVQGIDAATSGLEAVAGVTGLVADKAQLVSRRVGRAGPAQRASARRLLDELPQQLQQLAHQTDGALVIICGLLLGREGAVREKQLRLLRNDWGSQRFGIFCDHVKLLDGLPRLQRLPVVNLALPALKQLPADQRSTAARTIQQLIAADGKISLFEWALQALVVQQLRPDLKANAPVKLVTQLRHLRQLFSWLALAGRLSLSQASEHCAVAYASLEVKDVGVIPAQRLNPAEVTRALLALEALRPRDKKRLLDACQGLVMADEKVLVEELELLRTIAEILGCPLPLLALIDPARGE
ncbi:M48 family metallopeptidase [Aestuariirhabdus sp. LZHN29]|uniref:M48 family metallopeptidase n=1 Tax=Aestuariirhabdus sp. LZHN29 TaxID=3417462 RepID=UPI003CF188CD